MPTVKKPQPIDTSAGTSAYKLAVQHQGAIEPRLAAGALPALAADLTLLGADPNPVPPQPGPPSPAPPTLVQALASAVALTTAVYEAIHLAKATATVRKAYGVASRTAIKEPKAVIADGNKILSRAKTSPAEALSLGILPGDVDALSQALVDLQAADAAAKAKGGPTAKELRAAATRVRAAVARIAGAGILAFAKDQATRAQFEALKPKKV